METPPHYFRRALPHFQPNDAPYFVTYRLRHSIPGLDQLRLNAILKNGNSHEEQARYFQEFDFLLDAARHGPKYLARPEIMEIVKSSLNYAGEQWLDMIAYTIMPNHVHFVAELKGDRTLSQVMQSLKGFTSREANKILGQTGTAFWQPESYDRVVRDGRLGNTVYYILMNPVTAGLVNDWREWPGSYLSPEFYGIETLGLKAR
jgi:putative transposase